MPPAFLPVTFMFFNVANEEKTISAPVSFVPAMPPAELSALAVPCIVKLVPDVLSVILPEFLPTISPAFPLFAVTLRFTEEFKVTDRSVFAATSPNKPPALPSVDCKV